MSKWIKNTETGAIFNIDDEKLEKYLKRKNHEECEDPTKKTRKRTKKQAPKSEDAENKSEDANEDKEAE